MKKCELCLFTDLSIAAPSGDSRATSTVIISDCGTNMTTSPDSIGASEALLFECSINNCCLRLQSAHLLSDVRPSGVETELVL